MTTNSDPRLAQILNSPQGSIIGNTFNGLLGGFLNDLKETFPELMQLQMANQALQIASTQNPMQPLKAWMSSMQTLKEAGYEQPFFTECTEEKINVFLKLTEKMHPLINMLPLEDMWNDGGLIDEDRAAIWEHLRQLELSAMAIDAFEPDALNAIEGFAKEYMSELQGIDPSTVDVKSLGFDVIQRVMNDDRLKNLISTPEAEKRFSQVMGNNIESLLSGGAADSADPSASSSNPFSSVLSAMQNSGVEMPDTNQLQSVMQQLSGGSFSQNDISELLTQLNQANPNSK